LRRVIFDHNVPVPLERFLRACEVHLAEEMGWARLKNGQLLDAAKVPTSMQSNPERCYLWEVRAGQSFGSWTGCNVWVPTSPVLRRGDEHPAGKRIQFTIHVIGPPTRHKQQEPKGGVRNAGIALSLIGFFGTGSKYAPARRRFCATRSVTVTC
jgi:hypothetical protein